MPSTSSAVARPAVDADRAAVPHLRRNYTLGIITGGLAGLAQAFLHPELIVAGLIWALTQSPMLVAGVTIISKAGALAPQLWASTHLEHRPTKMPYFVAVILVRAAALAAMVGTLSLLRTGGNGWGLAGFFAAYLAVCVSGGSARVVYLDMVGRMIPRGRLGTYFGTRTFLGNLLAILAGAVAVQPILQRVALPTNYLLIVIVGGAVSLLDMSLFSRCRELPGPSARRRTTLGESLWRGFKWLRTDHNYRMYLWMRVAFRMNYLGLAFFIPYGTRALDVRGPGGLAVLGGIMVAVMQVSRMLASIVWGRLADRRGFRGCFLGAGACFLVAPALALLAPRLPAVFAVPIPGTAAVLDLPLAVYLLALLALGVATQGNIIGGSHFVVSSAPPRRRPSYSAFVNTVTSPLTLLPMAGAWLAGWVGMASIFALVAAGGLLMMTSAAAMRPPRRPRTRPVPPSPVPDDTG